MRFSFFALPRRARILSPQHGCWNFPAATSLRQGVLSAPLARLLAGFVLDEVRRDDLPARSAEAPGAVVEREVAERSQQERGRVVVVEGVEVLEDK